MPTQERFLSRLFTSCVFTNSSYPFPLLGQNSDLIKKEPKVKEAIITEANVLYVSVIDDGTRRDGYASYLCEILREKKAKAQIIRDTLEEGLKKGKAQKRDGHVLLEIAAMAKKYNWKIIDGNQPEEVIENIIWENVKKIL